MAASICILDYGMGNLRSVTNALRLLGYAPTVASRPQELLEDAALVLPGVGAFGEAMARLRESGLAEALRAKVRAGTPLLGICLGMQLLARDSEESPGAKGLGLVPARVARLPEVPGVAVPHVGWNTVRAAPDSLLYGNIQADAHFFFDHSYHLVQDDPARPGLTTFGTDDILSSVEAGNIFAVQFHPEKSQTSGLRLLRNFLNLAERWRAAC